MQARNRDRFVRQDCATFAALRIAALCVVTAAAGIASGGTTPIAVGLEAELFPPTTAGSWGRAIALSGDTLAVGSEVGNGGAGEVFVYRRNSGTWMLTDTLRASDAANGDDFGHSLDLDGDVLAVGAPWKVESGSHAAGAAYVFTRVAGQWTQTAKLISTHVGQDAQYGSALRLDSGTLAVLAPRDVIAGTANTFVHVYVWSGSSWIPEAEIAEPGAYASNNDFGTALDLRGDTLVAGDPTFQWGGGMRGKAFVLVRNAGVWSPQATLVGSDTANNDRFGSSVAVDGDRVLVGAQYHTLVPQQSGAVYAFRRVGSAWTQTQEFAAHDTLGGDSFGASCALAGDRAAVGAWRQGGTGLAYAFSLAPNGTWVEAAELVPPDGVYFGFFGYRVALDGDGLAVQSKNKPGEPVYVYAIADLPTAIYCTAKVNSLGCTPAIASSGFSSMTDPTPFAISASQLVSQKNGLYFYGTHGRAAVAFQGGTLCVHAPIRRTSIHSTGGNPPPADCSGTLSIDFNAWIQGGLDPALVPGVAVDGQFWYRDPASPSTTGLSNAIEFGISI